MTLSLKHTFNSAKTDGADATLIQPSAWNSEHTITLDATTIVGNISGSTAAAAALTPAQGRYVLNAASSEAASYLGFVVNPFMEISQENGQTSVSCSNVTVYAADQTFSYLNTASAGTAVVQNVANPFSGTASYRRFRTAIKQTIGTVQASLAAGEFNIVAMQRIEGLFWKGLGWSTLDAASVDVVVVCQSSVTGTYSLALRPGTQDRSYVTSFSLTANTPTTVFVTIPGDTSGTWATDNTTAAVLTICAGVGTNNSTATNNSWQSGGYVGIVGGGTNLAATAAATFTVAYFNAFPTGVLPYTSAAQVDLAHLANMRRPYDDELRRCQRYWRLWGRAALGIWPAINSPSCRLTGPLGTEMRTFPTIALTTTAPIVERWNVSAYTGSGSTITTSSTYPRSVDVTINGFTTTTNYSDAAYMIADYFTLNARM